MKHPRALSYDQLVSLVSNIQMCLYFDDSTGKLNMAKEWTAETLEWVDEAMKSKLGGELLETLKMIVNKVGEQVDLLVVSQIIPSWPKDEVESLMVADILEEMGLPEVAQQYRSHWKMVNDHYIPF